MNEYVTASVDGQPALELQVDLRRGGQPSTFRAVLPPGAVVSIGPVELEFADTETRRALRQFAVEQVQTTGDGRTLINGRDLRRAWSRQVDPPARTASAQEVSDAIFRSCGLGDQSPRLPAGMPNVPPMRAGTLGDVFENLLSLLGLTCTVADSGDLSLLPWDFESPVDQSRVVRSAESTDSVPEYVEVVGGAVLEILELTDWQAVIPDSGTLRPLEDVLAEWGIPERAARQACLSDGGSEALLPLTGADAAERLGALKRYAYRLFRAEGDQPPWLPIGGVSAQGEMLPPALVATVARGKGRAPRHPGEDAIEELNSTVIEEFELDTAAGTVYLPRVPFILESANRDDPTLHARRAAGPPRIALTIARASMRAPYTLRVPGHGEGEPELLQAAHLVAVYSEAGELLNRAVLASSAQQLASRLMRSRRRSSTTLAGATMAIACGSCERVTIKADDAGLISTVIEAPSAAPAFAAPELRRAPEGQAAGPVPSGLHQPLNAYRAGPLVLRALGETPEGESVLAMEATHYDRDTAALTLEHPGSLAFPFFLASEDAAKFGRWFFVAGVEAADAGRLRVLAPDDRHEDVSTRALFEARHVAPRGLRGLIVSLGTEPRFVDTGPLISDTRGRDPGAASSLVYDLDGSTLSQRKRGGLQFLSVLVLSPAHRDEGARDRGWVPALNLREGDTDSPENLGRGLFAEGSGRDLGRLTAKQQGGPILADGAACTKHIYGTTADDDGLYRETAGHLSTDAFFKVPGDPVHDAPLTFYAEPFAGAVPPWPPYEAQIKYEANVQHDWNRTKREGRWKIQYRLPFLPEIPPTWDPPIGPPQDPPVDDPPDIHIPVPSYLPRDIRPTISEHELWAPSHDWVPAPSDRTGGEVPFPGPSIKSEGWSSEANGHPDPSLGGGCIYLPPGTAMPDAQIDSGTRQTFLALHPEVVLALGHPHFEAGRVHSGWAIQLATSGGQLELLPRDSDGATPPGMTRGVHIAGHLSLGPDGANFDDTQALRLGENDDEGISFGEDVQLYREAEATLRTDADVEIGGKLTVEGLIDPTGLELDPQSANPGGAPGNTLWISSADSRARIGANVLAYASEIINDKRVEVLTYTGSGEEEKSVVLTDINRAHVLLIFRDDATTQGCVLALPFGATGEIRDRDLSDGSSAVALTLDAPGSGAQTLTINSTAGGRNASGVPYKLLVIGTP